MKELHLVKFLKEHPQDWEEILKAPPYNLSIKKEDDVVLFKYNQIASDFSLPLVQEARGIILEEGTWKVLRLAFTKFFNIQESHAHPIDWNSARVLEKIDGSLISVWYYKNKWRISTSGLIDANKGNVHDATNYTFSQLFLQACQKDPELFKELTGHTTRYLDRNLCYTFELVSPFNRIVVPYKEIDIYLIGIRDLSSLEEIDIYNSSFLPKISRPKMYFFNSIEDIKKACEELPFDREGYVVVDKYWNRVKIKSVAYVKAHYIKNNGAVTKKRIFDIIRIGEDSEFLALYPEYAEQFKEINQSYENFKSELKKIYTDFVKKYGSVLENKETYSRKEFAEWAKTYKVPHFLFGLLDKKFKDDVDYLNSLTTEGIFKYLEGEK